MNKHGLDLDLALLWLWCSLGTSICHWCCPKKKKKVKVFAGGLMVKDPALPCCGMGSIPGPGTSAYCGSGQEKLIFSLLDPE